MTTLPLFSLHGLRLGLDLGGVSETQAVWKVQTVLARAIVQVASAFAMHVAHL